MDLESRLSRKHISFLLFSIFLTASCALIYELLIGTICSYFLGDSVTHFSLVIGIFLSSMGVGTYLSRFINKDKDFFYFFFQIEIVLGIIGGLSIPILYAVFAFTHYFSLFALFFTFLVGALIGFEIPLVIRGLSGYIHEQKNISNVLSLDYLGGLLATFLFPFVLLPLLGLFKTCLIVGIVNISIGMAGFHLFQDLLDRKRGLFFYCSAIFFFILLIASLGLSKKIVHFWEKNLYTDSVILSEQSPYQKIVLTAKKGDIRLYLNGNLQFSSQDEYRYHESLVDIPMGLASNRNSVLILGGGDGMVVREILKYRDVKEITLVDIDKKVTEISRKSRLITDLNKKSLESNILNIVNEDAFKYLINTEKRFDVIISDLPDPNNLSLAKLYSREFFRFIKKRLRPDGVFVGQSTSPFFARNAFWCIKQTIESGGFKNIYPYHVNVPSFGEWGFILASLSPLDIDGFALNVPTRFLPRDISGFFYFEKDIKERTLEVSSLDQPTVLSYYLEGWEGFR